MFTKNCKEHKYLKKILRKIKKKNPLTHRRFLENRTQYSYSGDTKFPQFIFFKYSTHPVPFSHNVNSLHVIWFTHNKIPSKSRKKTFHFEPISTQNTKFNKQQCLIIFCRKGNSYFLKISFIYVHNLPYHTCILFDYNNNASWLSFIVFCFATNSNCRQVQVQVRRKQQIERILKTLCLRLCYIVCFTRNMQT